MNADCTSGARADGLRGERTRSAWIQLAAIACFAALAAPYFLGRVYVADDLGEFHLPVRNFYAEQLNHGEAFDWMPSLYGGFYVAAEGQLGAYHPLHLLLYRCLPLGAAFDVELLVSYPLLFVGTYLFLRRLVGRRDAASFGALVFTFGGFNLLHFVHPNAIAIVAHLPWLLLAIDVELCGRNRRQSAWAGVAIAMLTGSQLLLGYPQFVWFSLLAEAAFVFWRAKHRRIGMRGVGPIGLAVFCGVLLGAIQWLPTWHALSDSVRRAPDLGFANTGSLHPLNLLQLVAPYLFTTRVVGQNTHELGLYAGAVPLVLCVWLFAERRNWGRFRPLIRALTVFAVFSLLLAAGEHGGLYRLQSFIPLANRFRFPCRAIVLVQWCIASGSAVALALLLRNAQATGNEITRATSNTTRRALAGVFVVSVALAVMGPLAWPRFVADGWLVWCGPLLIGAAAGLVALAERGRQWAVAGLVVLTAVDLSCYGLSYAVYGHTADLHEFVADISSPPSHGGARVAAPHRAGEPRTGDRMLLAGLSRVDGYAGLEPAKQLDYRQLAALQCAGVDWIWQDDEQAAESQRRWSPVSPTAARARLITQVRRDDRGPDTPPPPLDTAVVDESLDIDPASAGTAQVVSDQPGRIAVETDAVSRQLLVTTESFDSYWRATVDDQPRPIVRVNGDFLGCVVEPGRHVVRFEFRPRAREAGVLAGACGLELMLCVFWLRVRGVRRDRGQPDTRPGRPAC